MVNERICARQLRTNRFLSGADTKEYGANSSISRNGPSVISLISRLVHRLESTAKNVGDKMEEITISAVKSVSTTKGRVSRLDIEVTLPLPIYRKTPREFQKAINELFNREKIDSSIEITIRSKARIVAGSKFRKKR